jgi:hypothetical protein
MKQQLRRLMEAIIPALIRALEFSRDGGRLAFELADRFGAIPPRQRLCPRCKRLY